jgi:hypothetical protein
LPPILFHDFDFISRLSFCPAVIDFKNVAGATQFLGNRSAPSQRDPALREKLPGVSTPGCDEIAISPAGTTERSVLFQPSLWDATCFQSFPALKRRAIFDGGRTGVSPVSNIKVFHWFALLVSEAISPNAERVS